jgi:hypothetical protein
MARPRRLISSRAWQEVEPGMPRVNRACAAFLPSSKMGHDEYTD